jgi:stearoyl-CoA desaturase (delta-9 desaturase)
VLFYKLRHGEEKLFSGFIQLSPKAVFLFMALSYVLTTFAQELYLHRSRSHRSITFHPVMCQLFRMWIWLNHFGVTAKTWVAVHRKHHAKSDTVEDPHSPVIHGVWTVLTKGVLLYRKAARDSELVKTYGVGIQEDWMDTHLYTKHRWRGPLFFLAAEIMLFGVTHGSLIWLFQISISPIWAAGFINGVFHHVGYRNNKTNDASRNFLPIGIIFCGAELHNNHHADPASAKLSMRWWEFDAGWLAIRTMSFFGLLKINRVSPMSANDESGRRSRAGSPMKPLEGGL